MSATEQTILNAKSLTECIAQMGDLIEDLVEKLTDNEYLNLMNTMKAIYEKQNTNPIIIQAQQQSRMRVRRAKLSTEQKLAKPDVYCVCEMCDRVVRKDGLREHQRSKVCLNTYTSKMLAVKEKTEHAEEETVKFTHIYAEMLTRRAGEFGGTNQLGKYSKYSRAEKARVMRNMFKQEKDCRAEATITRPNGESFYPYYYVFKQHENKDGEPEPAMRYDTVPWKNTPTIKVEGGLTYEERYVEINHQGEYLWENSYKVNSDNEFSC